MRYFRRPRQQRCSHRRMCGSSSWKESEALRLPRRPQENRRRELLPPPPWSLQRPRTRTGSLVSLAPSLLALAFWGVPVGLARSCFSASEQRSISGYGRGPPPPGRQISRPLLFRIYSSRRSVRSPHSLPRFPVVGFASLAAHRLSLFLVRRPLPSEPARLHLFP